MRKILTAGLATVVAAAFLCAATARASVWDEAGDAGDLPGTAQVTAGGGPLTAITGEIRGGTDVDLYRVFITGIEFSATTVGTAGTLANTQLFVFDADGIGVYANDDFTSTNRRSSLPALTPREPGLYLLAISGWDRDPVSTAGPIFPGAPPVGVFGPAGPGGGRPLSGYAGTGGTGTYTILLTGAEYAVVPEPGSLGLCGAGALGVTLLRLARRRRAIVTGERPGLLRPWV